MSSVIDLWAYNLGLTRETLLELITDVADGAIDLADRGDMSTDDTIGLFDQGLKVRTRNFGVPNVSSDDPQLGVFYIEANNIEDEDGAPLPAAYFRVTVEPIDRPVERNN